MLKNDTRCFGTFFTRFRAMAKDFKLFSPGRQGAALSWRGVISEPSWTKCTLTGGESVAPRQHVWAAERYANDRAGSAFTSERQPANSRPLASLAHANANG